MSRRGRAEEDAPLPSSFIVHFFGWGRPRVRCVGKVEYHGPLSTRAIVSSVHRFDMRTMFVGLTTLRHALHIVFFGAALVLLAACDSTEPTPSLESQFDITIGEPVNQSLTGPAALGNTLSFDDQEVFILPEGPFGKNITIIQLSGQNDDGVFHDLSFMHAADEPIEEGTYNIGASCEPNCGPFPPEELFTANYGRQTADSLHSYPIESGTVTVETVTDEGVEGTFNLTSPAKMSIAKGDIEALIDSLRSGPPRRDTIGHPSPPLTDVRVFEQPMTVEGSFAATSDQELSGQVPHFGGIVGGSVSDTTITIP